MSGPRKTNRLNVVIVPGVPTKKKHDSIMRMRVYGPNTFMTAVYQKYYFSGSAVYTHFVEGIVMKTMARLPGHSPGPYLCGNQSRAQHGKYLLLLEDGQRNGFQKLLWLPIVPIAFVKKLFKKSIAWA